MALTKVKGSGLATGAATDSLVGIDDNATSTAITINASENVGIGTSSPDALVHLEGLNATDNSNPTTLRFTDTDPASATNQIIGRLEFENVDISSAGVGSYIQAVAENTGGTHYLAFGTGSGGSAAERMRIDSAGRVTMPSQPAFKVAWGSRSATGANRFISTNDGDTVATGRDEFNTGNHFDAATGRFTAPVAGTYLLGFQGIRNGTNGSSLDCRIKKNGSTMWARAYLGSFNTSHDYWSIVTTTKCAAGDYFQVFLGSNTSIYNDDTYSYGHLLG